MHVHDEGSGVADSQQPVASTAGVDASRDLEINA